MGTLLDEGVASRVSRVSGLHGRTEAWEASSSRLPERRRCGRLTRLLLPSQTAERRPGDLQVDRPPCGGSLPVQPSCC